MKRGKIIGLSVLLFLIVLHAGSQGKSDTREIIPLGESISFNSNILGEERRINVYLPEDYDETTHSYPVIYLLDGSVDEDFIHVAGLLQFATFSWIQMIPETILVGIANTDRQRDFTYPSANEGDRQMMSSSGESGNFIQFLETELQPLIESRYRTQSHSTLIGQSLGGLLATEILLKKPELFENYVIVSPSLWWDSRNLLRHEVKGKARGVVYIAVGKEGEVMEDVAKNLFEKLHPLYSDNIHFSFLSDKDHGDVLHQAVYDAIEETGLQSVSDTVKCRIETSKGDIDVELYAEAAPRTVANFLKYVDNHKYDSGSFFRVTTPENEAERDIRIQVIQGGAGRGVSSYEPIKMESTAETGILHKDGVISMARSGPDTATSSFFICIDDQPELDFGGKRNPDGQGFAAFGKVVQGMDVVRKIQSGPNENQRLLEPVTILRIRRLN